MGADLAEVFVELEVLQQRMGSIERELREEREESAPQIEQMSDSKLLEELIRERTYALVMANKELEAFNYTITHDLSVPLHSIDGFSEALEEDYGKQLDDVAKDYLWRIRKGVKSLRKLLDDLQYLSQVMCKELCWENHDLSAMTEKSIIALQALEPERRVTVDIQPKMVLRGDVGLLNLMLENLLDNAWKFTKKSKESHIEVGCINNEEKSEDTVYYVKDNGAGFDMHFSDRLFMPFHRLHRETEFEGQGIGLATVERIIRRHGGRIWGEGEVNGGATFYFVMPPQSEGGSRGFRY